jgi:hypothetical protein
MGFDCLSGDPVKWDHLRTIMQRIKTAATTLGWADQYSSPLDEVHSPYSIPWPISMELYQTFEVDHDNTVTAAYLTEEGESTDPWTPTNYVADAAEAGDLVLVADADGCWCKSMWLVVPGSNGGFTLKETSGSSMGCCQTLKVPNVGDVLDEEQYWVTREVLESNPDERWHEADRCTSGPGGLLYKGDAYHQLQTVQRKVSGNLTLIIRKAHFEQILTEVKQLAQTSGHLRPIFEIGWSATCALYADICTGSELVPPTGATMEQWLFDLTNNMVGGLAGHSYDPALFEDPGCTASYNSCGDAHVLLRPWETPTCSADVCGEGLKLYCNTMLWLYAVADIIDEIICPQYTNLWDASSLVIDAISPGTEYVWTPGESTSAPGVLVVNLGDSSCEPSPSYGYFTAHLFFACSQLQVSGTAYGSASAYKGGCPGDPTDCESLPDYLGRANVQLGGELCVGGYTGLVDLVSNNDSCATGATSVLIDNPDFTPDAPYVQIQTSLDRVFAIIYEGSPTASGSTATFTFHLNPA